MKLLLDQNTPVALRYRLRGHEVCHTDELSWGELENGELIAAAEKEHFDVFISCDQNLQYQQNLRGRKIAVVLLSTNNWKLIRLNTGQITEAVANAEPGGFVLIECGRFSRSGR